jgi:hypothetical protein
MAKNKQRMALARRSTREHQASQRMKWLHLKRSENGSVVKINRENERNENAESVMAMAIMASVANGGMA